MNRAIDQSTFDEAFYPKKSTLKFFVFTQIISAIVFSGFAVYLFFNPTILGRDQIPNLYIKIVAAVYVILSFVFNFFVIRMTLKRMKTLQVGFNKDLLYVKSYGFVDWKDIEKVELQRDRKMYEIKVTLAEDIPEVKKKYGNKIFITGVDIGIDLQELYNILKNYHEKYS